VLHSGSWSSFAVAALTLASVTIPTAGVAVGLLAQNVIVRSTMFWLIGATAFVSIVLVFLALEGRRLYERSVVLRELYNAQKHYEILLRDARDERDQLAQANAELTHQNAALRAMQTFVGVAMAARAAAERNEP
jgi:hypothetical protein